MSVARTIRRIVMIVAVALAAPAHAEPDATLARHQKRCDRGDARACLAAAEVLDRTDGVSDEERLRYFRAACDGGASRGCFRAGALLATQTPPSFDGALAVFEKGCRGGDGPSCGGAGSVLHSADFGPKDWARALPYYRKACDRGAAIACLEAGYAVESGRDGAPVDPALALTFYQGACKARSAPGCRAAGGVALRTSKTPADRGRALTLFTRACDAGDADGCLEGAKLHLGESGALPRGVANRKRGRTMVAEGCRRQSAALPADARSAHEYNCLWSRDPDGEPMGVSGGEDETDGIEGGVVGGVIGGDSIDVAGLPPPPPPPPRSVPPGELEKRRIAGTLTVAPSGDAAAELGDRAAAARVALRVCVGASGATQSINVIRSSGSAAYDRAAQLEVRAWRFRPYQDAGKAIPVCTAIEIRASAR